MIKSLRKLSSDGIPKQYMRNADDKPTATISLSGEELEVFLQNPEQTRCARFGSTHTKKQQTGMSVFTVNIQYSSGSFKQGLYVRRETK